MSFLTRDFECDECHGSRKIYVDKGGDEDGRVTCPECLGGGNKLTEIGRELVEFLRKHKKEIFDK